MLKGGTEIEINKKTQKIVLTNLIDEVVEVPLSNIVMIHNFCNINFPDYIQFADN